VDRRRRTLLALVAAALWLVPSMAGAADSSTPAPTAPLVTAGTDVQFWMAAKPSEAVVIVSVALPDSVTLPVTVRLPVVEGMTVDWAGEISGGDASEDLQREYVTKKGSEGGSYIEFVVSEFPVAQVDLSGKPLVVNGDEVSASFEFVQSTVSSETVFSVRLPAVASDVRIQPDAIGEPTTNEVGETLHVLPTVELKQGEKSTVEVAYSTALPGVPATEGDTAINTLIGVISALAVAVIVALFVISRRTAARANVVRDELSDHE